MPRLWSDKQLAKLILCIKSNRFYWDTKDSDYHTQSKRDELIRRFSEETNIPVYEVKCKWRNLRSHFAREMRRGVYSWYLYDDLRFLEDFVSPRPSRRASRNRVVSDSDSSCGSQDDTEEETQNGNSAILEIIEKSKKMDPEQDRLLRTAASTLDALTDRLQEQDTVDEFTTFAEIIANELRSEANPQVLAYAKFKISEILYQRATGLLVPPNIQLHNQNGQLNKISNPD